MSDDARTDFQAAFDAGQRAASLVVPANVEQSGVMLSPGAAMHSTELLAPRPWRIRARPVLETLDAFVAYLELYRHADTIVFADRRLLTITAVIDYHEASGRASWGDHVVTLALKPTPEWTAWSALHNNTKTDQVTFAEFVEEHVLDILEPDGAAVLELARNFQAHRNVEFKSGVSLQNGATRFTYEEEVRGTAQNGQIDIPYELVIALAPWEGAAPYRIRARFRYRVGQTGLNLWVSLVQLDKVVLAAFDDLTTGPQGLTGRLDGLRVLRGTLPLASLLPPRVEFTNAP